MFNNYNTSLAEPEGTIKQKRKMFVVVVVSILYCNIF